MGTQKATRRKYDRIGKTVLLDIYKPDAFKPSCRACLTDISVGGAGFESSVKFNLNDRINLVFTMPDSKEYIIEGIIRRISRSTGTFSYGVEFLPMGFFKKLSLRKFIKKLLKIE